MPYRTQRQARYYALMAAGFLRFEAKELSVISIGEAPYLRQMIRQRKNLRQIFLREAHFNKWSPTKLEDEYKKVIRHEYIDNRWTTTKGEMPRIGSTSYRASPWMMLKDFRNDAIEQGDYAPKPKKHDSKDALGHIHIDKGNVDRQKQRAKIRREHDPQEMARWKKQRAAQRQRAKQRKLRELH